MEKAKAKAALKAYNKVMRPSLGTSVHAIFEGYYLQKVPGAWHAPRLWINLAEAWLTRAGQIALTGRQHMPAPASLAWVACEELVTVQPTPGWVGEWPRLGGTPDLVTITAHGGVLHYHPESECYWVAPEFDSGDGLVVDVTGVTAHEVAWAYGHVARFRLYDYKTTLSFEYAKTPEELRDEDEQSAIYALAVMQEHGLSELACTWVYMRTKGAPASMPVHFTMTRAHAEARVAALAPQALELQRLTERYLALPRGFMGDGQRLALLQSLPTDDNSCGNYGGCPFAAKAGGFCKPKKSSLGAALRKQAAEKQRFTDRKQAVKANREEGKSIMLNAEQTARLATLEAMPADGEGKRSFPQNQEMIKLRKKAKEDAPAGAAEETKPVVEASGEEAPADAPAEVKPTTPAAKPTKGAAAPAADGDTVTASALGITFEVAKSSPLFKAILKVAKAKAAFDAAMAGEL